MIKLLLLLLLFFVSEASCIRTQFVSLTAPAPSRFQFWRKRNNLIEAPNQVTQLDPLPTISTDVKIEPLYPAQINFEDNVLGRLTAIEKRLSHDWTDVVVAVKMIVFPCLPGWWDWERKFPLLILLVVCTPIVELFVLLILQLILHCLGYSFD